MTDELLFLSHAETLDLLSPAEAMAVCEDVYRMHAEGTVSWTEPPAFRLDDDRFHHHWHVKGALLSEIPISGVRLYAYYEDSERSTVGTLDATRYIVLSDPVTSVALAIVEEHWTYAIRSTAAAVPRLQVDGEPRPPGARPGRRRHDGDDGAAMPQ